MAQVDGALDRRWNQRTLVVRSVHSIVVGNVEEKKAQRNALWSLSGLSLVSLWSLSGLSLVSLVSLSLSLSGLSHSSPSPTHLFCPPPPPPAAPQVSLLSFPSLVSMLYLVFLYACSLLHYSSVHGPEGCPSDVAPAHLVWSSDSGRPLRLPIPGCQSGAGAKVP